MSTQVKVAEIGQCDLCFHEEGKVVPAYADAKLSIGPWAYVCREHFKIYGCSLGTGRGQELVLRDGGAE